MEISTAILILAVLAILAYVDMLDDAYRAEVQRSRQEILKHSLEE